MNKIEEEYKRADKIMRQEKREKKIGTDEKTKKRKAEIISEIENGNKQGVNTVKKTTAKKPGNGKIKPMKKKKWDCKRVKFQLYIIIMNKNKIRGDWYHYG